MKTPHFARSVARSDVQQRERVARIPEGEVWGTRIRVWAMRAQGAAAARRHARKATPLYSIFLAPFHPGPTASNPLPIGPVPDPQSALSSCSIMVAERVSIPAPLFHVRLCDMFSVVLTPLRASSAPTLLLCAHTHTRSTITHALLRMRRTHERGPGGRGRLSRCSRCCSR